MMTGEYFSFVINESTLFNDYCTIFPDIVASWSLLYTHDFVLRLIPCVLIITVSASSGFGLNFDLVSGFSARLVSFIPSSLDN